MIPFSIYSSSPPKQFNCPPRYYGNIAERYVKCQQHIYIISYYILFYLFTGEWLLMLVYLFKDKVQDQILQSPGESSLNGSRVSTDITTESLLERWRLQHLHLFLIMSISVSFLMFWGVGGFFQYYYYINRRDRVGFT